MSVIMRLKQCSNGPSLYGTFKEEADKTSYVAYTSNRCERLGNLGVYLVDTFWKVVKWTSPIFIIYYCYKNTIQSLFPFIFTEISKRQIFFFIFTIPRLVRTVGRLMNPEYIKFQDALENKTSNLNMYDYDFSEWYSIYPTEGEKVNPESYASVPDLFKWLIARIALKIVYPGSTSVVNTMLSKTLHSERIKLIVEYKAKRFKIMTRDSNDIDVIFINRQNSTIHGDTLVIVCEGNCGYYEVGSMRTAIDANYSVVGWNHPGFGGSTGRPFPSQEKNAIEAVMEFAEKKLNFSHENILIYGWSIGGFTSSWAASKFPAVKGLILDATFDNILPLAKTRVPNIILPLAVVVIRDKINLDVLNNVKGYNGPVSFIRRSQDEMICTEDGKIGTNRCNFLVAGFLKHRYPEIFDSKREELMRQWLEGCPIKQGQLRDMYHVDKTKGTNLLRKYRGENSSFEFPIVNGENLSDNEKNMLTIHLLDTHLMEYPSTHCVPLPVSLFREPTI